MDPDGRVEQNVVTQLLEQQDAILQVAQVSGKGQRDVQDGPCHVHLGRLKHRRGDRKCHNRRWGVKKKKKKERVSVKGVKDVGSRKGGRGTRQKGEGKDTCRERRGGGPLLPNKHTSQL